MTDRIYTSGILPPVYRRDADGTLREAVPAMPCPELLTEEEAIRKANDTPYGLAGAVFTKDGARAQRFIRKLRAGVTWINTFHLTFNEAPKLRTVLWQFVDEPIAPELLSTAPYSPVLAAAPTVR